jgi:AcrR family transcriptional regulator
MPPVRDTKELLLDAAEHLFARDGIQGALVREINELAGQRNPSALHYHFGSREGLLSAIMLRHQAEIDKAVEHRLDELERAGDPAVRDVIAAVVEPMVELLKTQSGRNWARIVPQILPIHSDNLRLGVLQPTTPQMHRVLELLRARIAHLPETLQRERLVDYGIVLAALIAERAHHVETVPHPALGDAQFADHLVDVLDAILAAPSSAS